MEVEEVLRRLGGVATRAQLVAVAGRRQVDAALAAGRVVAVARGRYALPGIRQDVEVAHAVTGVLSHRSAALHHGWALLREPVRPHVTVPRKRVVSARRRRLAQFHYADLLPDDLSGVVTSQERTVVDCLRTLPFDEALAVADSVLRAGRSPGWLTAQAGSVRGRGAGRARRVVGHATGLAANPFESGLRAAAITAGLLVRPQVPLFGPEFLGRPDLVDVQRRLVLEADSFAWHGTRSGLVRDARRYNEFVLAGWTVLRFTWEDVVLHPRQVVALLESFVAEQAKVATWPR